MAYFIYNAAPGTMWFRGNEIKAEPGRWTEVSAHSVQLGTFTSMRRLKHVYLVEASEAPTYDPRHPDNKARVESQAPGAAVKAQEKDEDGSMTPEQLKAYLASKNADEPVMPEGGLAVNIGEAKGKGKVESITADSLAEIGLPPATEPEVVAPAPADLKFETLGETEPFVKEAKTKKASKAKAQSLAEVTTEAAAKDGVQPE